MVAATTHSNKPQHMGLLPDKDMQAHTPRSAPKLAQPIGNGEYDGGPSLNPGWPPLDKKRFRLVAKRQFILPVP